MTNRIPLAFGLTALLTGVVVLLLGAPAATAQPPVAGTLTVSPASGPETAGPAVTTSAGCPTPANAYHIQLIGPGAEADRLDFLVTGRTTAQFSNTAPFSAQFGQTFKDAAALDTPPKTITPGRYTINLNCVSGVVGGTVVATFRVTVDFSVVGGVLTYQVTGGEPTSSTTTTTTSSTTSSSTTTSTTSTSPTSSSSSTTTGDGNLTTTTTTEAPVAANSNFTGNGGNLARTGAAPMPLIWLGLLLCFIGGLYLLAARRRGVS